jgi:hypothetical protein
VFVSLCRVNAVGHWATRNANTKAKQKTTSVFAAAALTSGALTRVLYTSGSRMHLKYQGVSHVARNCGAFFTLLCFACLSDNDTVLFYQKYKCCVVALNSGFHIVGRCCKGSNVNAHWVHPRLTLVKAYASHTTSSKQLIRLTIHACFVPECASYSRITSKVQRQLFCC